MKEVLLGRIKIGGGVCLTGYLSVYLRGFTSYQFIEDLKKLSHSIPLFTIESE